MYERVKFEEVAIYLDCKRGYRVGLGLGLHMLGDMRCHTGCTPSHLDTVYRTEIDIFSYEYMGNIFISCTSRAAVGSSIVGHCSSGIHVPRNSTSPLGQKHAANTSASA